MSDTRGGKISRLFGQLERMREKRLLRKVQESLVNGRKVEAGQVLFKLLGVK